MTTVRAKGLVAACAAATSLVISAAPAPAAAQSVTTVTRDAIQRAGTDMTSDARRVGTFAGRTATCFVGARIEVANPSNGGSG